MSFKIPTSFSGNSSEKFSSRASGRNLVYLVADPKQAIYGFRGADVDTYLEARGEVEQAGTPRVPLIDNFRSTSAMIEAYNHILDQSSNASFFDGPIHVRRPGQERPRIRRASTTIGSPAVPIHLLRIEPESGDELATAELKRSLARQIARTARDLLREETGLSFGTRDDNASVSRPATFIFSPRPTAIPIRSLGRCARPAFRMRSTSRTGLFQTDQAREVRDLLAAIDDPADPAKRGRAWITPFFAVPLAALPDLTDLPDSAPAQDEARSIGTNWQASGASRGCSREFSRRVASSAASYS